MRPSWDSILIRNAFLISERSTCAKIHVGAIITKDNRIISIGYNGVPSGMPHCEDYFHSLWELNLKNNPVYKKEFKRYKDFIESNLFLELHKKWSEQHEIHAEMNAIAFAAKNGISTKSSIMYCTHSPCFNCAKTIIQSGVKKVFYVYKYQELAIDFMRDTGVKVEQLKKV